MVFSAYWVSMPTVAETVIVIEAFDVIRVEGDAEADWGELYGFPLRQSIGTVNQDTQLSETSAAYVLCTLELYQYL